MKKISLMMVIGGFLMHSLSMNGMFARVTQQLRSGRTYASKTTQLANQRKELRQERDRLAKEMADIEKTEEIERERLGEHKAYSNSICRYGHKTRTTVKLENVQEKLSKKAPSAKEAAQIKASIPQLQKETEQLERTDAYLRKYNMFKWYADHDFVALPLEINPIRLETMKWKLKKFEEKQQKKLSKE